MRILFAHSFYRASGGEDRHVHEQVELVSQAHDVELIAEANLDLSESPATAARMLYSHTKKRETGLIIDRFSPDIVHIHNMYPSIGPAVLLAAIQRRIPVVLTVHNYRLRCPNGLMFTEGGTCRRCESGMYVNALTHRCFPTRKQAGAYAAVLWAHRFAMRLERHVSRFVVPSEFMRQRLLEWGFEEERIRMVRHFIRSVDTAETNAEVGSYGAFLGRLTPEKGVHVLLAALRRAGDPPFLVIGDGPQRAALESLATRLRLANTKFLGWLPTNEVDDLIARARYVAVPSLWEETANLAALETLAAGRPLLVSARGALPELVSTGAGVTSRPGDEMDISTKISLLRDDDELCRRASKEAQRFARQWLSPSRHLADLEKVYRAVCVGEVA